jgi:hypothetical protein
MQKKARQRLAIAALLTAAVALPASGALASARSSTLSLVLRPNGNYYVTQAGASTTFPGHLGPGDRILGRDTLMSGQRAVGYDNEICTATFDANDYCTTTLVLGGKGELEVSWLWIGRNTSAEGPPTFSGVVSGGTGSYKDAHGQFEATVLPTGELQVIATLH